MRVLAVFLTTLISFICEVLPCNAGSDTTSIRIERSQNSFTVASGSSPQVLSTVGDAPASSASNGPESSQCQPYGRASAARSEARSQILFNSMTEADVRISADAYANGGHFRTCDACIANACVGIHGNDTDAQANASASAKFVVSVKSDLAKFTYVLRVATSNSSGKVTSSVQDAGGVSVGALPDEPNSYVINEKKPILLVSVSVEASASDRGGCCSSHQSSGANVSIHLEKAALLEVNSKLEPYIVGGIPTTTGFKNVVAVGYRNRMHCTGVFVGTKTIITAAHCVYGREDEIRAGLMDVIFGNSFGNPAEKFTVKAAEIPSEGVSGVNFDPKNLDDDVALLYISGPPEAAPASLHKGTPAWKDVVENKMSVYIVGFGLNIVDGAPGGAGTKREAQIKVDDLTNKTFLFAASHGNTCHGDSGGPAFLDASDGSGFILAGITSRGDGACDKGVDLRIDAYQHWLLKHII